VLARRRSGPKRRGLAQDDLQVWQAASRYALTTSDLEMRRFANRHNAGEQRVLPASCSHQTKAWALQTQEVP
jgi:hypothetical protein